jgi:putative membrane protein
MRTVAAILFFAYAGAALGHDGKGYDDWLWTTSLWVSGPLAVSGGLYTVGVIRLWRRVGVGRGVRLWQAVSFAFGWLLLIGALVSPLHWLGERLFMAHMAEHEILMALAAPLLAVARPIGGMIWAFPSRWRPAIGGLGQTRIWGTVGRWLTDPPVATLLHGIALWAWHAPVLYDAALMHPMVHWAQHLSFLVTALLFWWSLLQGRARQRGYGAAVFYLFATALHSGFLGILLTVAREPIYPLQTSAAPAWGLTPLEDQQLAGLIMWIPAGLVYAVAALALAGLWIRHSGLSAKRGGDHALITR